MHQGRDQPNILEEFNCRIPNIKLMRGGVRSHQLLPEIATALPHFETKKMSVVQEAPGYLQVFSDGSILRFQQPAVSASTESEDGYMSKDVTIEASKNITARVFLPVVDMRPLNGLPVLMYFHGGGFCIGSTSWLGYHQFLGDLCVKSQCIILSVDYRLAPDNRLPTAYEDCYTSLEWLCQMKRDWAEPWFEQADLSRVFLSGDSAGANIAHHVAVKAQRAPEYQATIRGLLLIHPYFGSERRTEKESANETAMEVLMNDMFWRLSIPEGLNRDYFGCNYEMMKVSDEEWGRFPEVMVHVAELDFLKERGVLYSEFLKNQGVRRVDLIEAVGEQHVYHVFYPESEATRLLQQQMSSFINKF